ncbi:sensor histidine kinase [Rubellimicrobium arenae]|uniref:sensor histidine kinase n=1 Tax=Rubellimicrobium arenae TaxID=2817372 RepID=UPI001B31201B|nr:cache domain-containing protein [Rubellimicrobium arenae]
MRLSVAQRVIAITASALIPILLALLYNEIALRQSREAEVRGLALAAATQAALEMERLTSGSAGILQAIAAAPAVQSFDREPCTRYLDRLKPLLPQFKSIIVTDTMGRVACRDDLSDIDLDVAEHAYFQEALAAKGRLVVGDFTVARVTGDKVLPLALAVTGADGRAVGVVTAVLDLEWLAGSLRERKIAANGSLTIADPQGVIIAREPFPERFVGTTIPDSFQSFVHSDAPGTAEVLSQDGTTRILGFVPVGAAPAGLYVSAGISRNEAFRPINLAMARTFALTSAAAILAALLSWGLGQRLVRGPVSQIASVLAARRSGNDDARTRMKSRDGEIEALGAEFDSYMDELNASRAERDRVEAELRSMARETERLAQRNELLAREMSHRVMNSFQLMESTFSLQSRRISDPVAQAAVRDAEERLRAMALVHRQLFRLTRDEVQSLDAGAYLRGLARELEAAFLAGNQFDLEVEAGEGILLAPARGIALGLLVTELVINAVKHAFRGRDRGSIRIVLSMVGEGSLRLVVADDGTGLPPAETRSGSGGVGMKLLDGFVRQLEGTLAIEGPPGTRFVVTFPAG